MLNSSLTKLSADKKTATAVSKASIPNVITKA